MHRLTCVICLSLALVACAGAAQTNTFVPAPGFQTAGDVYIAFAPKHGGPGGGIYVYGPSNEAPLALITDGITSVVAMAVHGTTLYVANIDQYEGDVTLYAAGSVSPLRKISNGITSVPRSMAFDGAGDLFVATSLYFFGLRSGGVSEYAPGGESPKLQLQGTKLPDAVAVDGVDDVYVANTVSSFRSSSTLGKVTVYAPDRRRVLRTISAGINSPAALTFDASGNLYVLNVGYYATGYVTVYARGTGALLRTISQGMAAPSAIALDPSGNLYVANFGATRSAGGTVTVYAAGKSSLLRSIKTGTQPFALAIDAAGDLYVANGPLHGANAVTKYAPGGKRLLHRYSLAAGQLVTALALAQ
jgi:DNA-binding beta-propeller fold protein YncE